MRVVSAVMLSALLHLSVIAINSHFSVSTDGHSQAGVTIGYVERPTESFRFFEAAVDAEQVNKASPERNENKKITISEQQAKPAPKLVQGIEERVVDEVLVTKTENEKQDVLQSESQIAPEDQVDATLEGDRPELEDTFVEQFPDEVDNNEPREELLFEKSPGTTGGVDNLAGKLVATRGDAFQSALPRYDINPRPEYPLVARKRGWEGVVLFEILILENGRVGEIQMIRSSGYRSLDAAAKKVVRRWKFVPATVLGMPVESQVQVPIRFSLQAS